MTVLRPSQLPPGSSANPAGSIPIDQGSTVEKVTPKQVVDAGRPLATQVAAETGASNDDLMSSLRVSQAIDAQAATIEAVNERPTFTELASTAPGEGAALVGTEDGQTAQDKFTVLDYFINIMMHIPKVEHAAILAGTSTYDIGPTVNTLLAGTNKSISFPKGRYYVNTTIREATSGGAARLMGSNFSECIFVAGPALKATNLPMFWFGNNSGHGVYRLWMSDFRIEGGDFTVPSGAGLADGAGAAGAIGIRLQECGYSYVGNFWARGCHTAVENIGSIGLKLGGYNSILSRCRYGVRDYVAEGANFHGLPSLDPDDITKTMSGLSLRPNAAVYENLTIDLTQIPLVVRGGGQAVRDIVLQSSGFTNSDDLIQLISANEAKDYGNGPKLENIWHEGGSARSVIRITNTRGAQVRQSSFYGHGSSRQEQAIIVETSPGVRIDGNQFAGVFDATPSEGRLANASYYVKSADSPGGMFTHNYHADNQVTPYIEGEIWQHRHIHFENHLISGATDGMTIGAIRIAGNTIGPNPDLAAVGPYNITGIATLKDRNGNQLLTTSQTGWAADTGTATKTSSATYTAPTISATYTQAEVQAMADALQAATRSIKALKDLVIYHGLGKA